LPAALQVWLRTFQLRCHTARLACGALATILVRIRSRLPQWAVIATFAEVAVSWCGIRRTPSSPRP